MPDTGINESKSTPGAHAAALKKLSMPYEKNGLCPFNGDHWPVRWPDVSVTKTTFPSLDEDQRMDLILYFWNHEASTTPEKKQPKYAFYLETFRPYFGQEPKNIKKIVMNSPQYLQHKLLAEERNRQPPPPEMSLVTPNLIDAFAELDRPSQEAEASAAGAAIPSIPAPPVPPPPQSPGEPPVIALTARGN
jgi:hypothetical protein